jgi:hypothetical protein
LTLSACALIPTSSSSITTFSGGGFAVARGIPVLTDVATFVSLHVKTQVVGGGRLEAGSDGGGQAKGIFCLPTDYSEGPRLERMTPG